MGKSKGSTRKPKRVEQPGGPQIRKREDPDKFNKRHPSWLVNRIDRNAKWGWREISEDDLWGKIISKLQNFESMNWETIKKGRSHNVEVYKLIPEARKRLMEMKLTELEELFSLRLGGLQRIWGILNQGVLSILWYDPKHQVCLSKRKHT